MMRKEDVDQRKFVRKGNITWVMYISTKPLIHPIWFDTGERYCEGMLDEGCASLGASCLMV